MGYIGENPFRSLKNVRLPQRIVEPFSADEIARLLAACESDVPAGARDYVMLLTLLDIGIRCSELVQLAFEDLDLEDGRLRILHAKGNKQRVVSFARRCREALEQYLGLRGIEPGPLFPASSRHGQLRAGVALQPNGYHQACKNADFTDPAPKILNLPG